MWALSPGLSFSPSRGLQKLKLSGTHNVVFKFLARKSAALTVRKLERLELILLSRLPLLVFRIRSQWQSSFSTSGVKFRAQKSEPGFPGAVHRLLGNCCLGRKLVCGMAKVRGDWSLPDVGMSVSLVSAFLCCGAATFLLLKWRRRRTVQRKMKEAKWRRERALQQMETAARKFKEQVKCGKGSCGVVCPRLKIGSSSKEFQTSL